MGITEPKSLIHVCFYFVLFQISSGFWQRFLQNSFKNVFHDSFLNSSKDHFPIKFFKWFFFQNSANAFSWNSFEDYSRIFVFVFIFALANFLGILVRFLPGTSFFSYFFPNFFQIFFISFRLPFIHATLPEIFQVLLRKLFQRCFPKLWLLYFCTNCSRKSSIGSSRHTL